MSGHVNVSTRRDDRVLVIELDSPSSANALSLPMLTAVEKAVSTAHEYAGAVVLRGAGSAFCSGVDGRAVYQAVVDGWSVQFDELVTATHDTLRALLACPVPLIAAVDGGAAGVGATCALLADMRVVSHRARLRPGHLAAGAPLDGGASFALAYALGPARAMSILLDNRKISGDDLHRWGLAEEPVPPADADQRALDLADTAAELDREAVVSARALLRHAGMRDFEEQWAAEVSRLRQVVESGRLAAVLAALWDE